MTKEQQKQDSVPGLALALFPSGMAPPARRRRLIFLGLWLAVTSMLVWPIYPWLASGLEPRILGLPFSFAWVVISLFVMFGALLWLFVADERSGEALRSQTTPPDTGHRES